MQITTTRFGEIEIDDELVFEFIEPILGYDKLKKYVLIDNSPESPFKWLQSVEDPNIAFPITFPSYFSIDYKFTVPEDKAQKLEVKNAENVLTFNIACIPQGQAQDATINLVGPIVINVESKKGLQLVLTDTKYSIKHRLFDKDKAQCSS